MRVGIVGLGVIGCAQVETFNGHDLVIYDAKDDTEYPDFSGCDMVLVCVGTPESETGHADLRYVEAAAGALPETVPTVLRSTVPPGTTDRVLGNGSRLYCHAPEFMGENPLHSWQKSSDVPYMLLGGDPVSTAYFRSLFVQVFPGVIHEYAAMESELAKYAANLYWATRVTFINELAAICDHFGVDYENVREAWLNDPRMTSVYTKLEGYQPGFDGRCWPKDLAALTAASDDAGYDAGFLRAVAEANKRFRA